MNDRKELSNNIKHFFCTLLFNEIKTYDDIDDRTLDNIILDRCNNKTIKTHKIKLEFIKPIDEIYKSSSGRTPYDLLCIGKINNRNVTLLINNKFGELSKSNLNDITTYNNLLRLYLSIKNQRLKNQITIDKQVIYNRIIEKDILMYGIFILDKSRDISNFFFLEEIKGDLYINPRNTMLQTKYNPSLLDKPLDYYAFMEKLFNGIELSLKKNIASTQTELTTLLSIRNLFKEINPEK